MPKFLIETRMTTITRKLTWIDAPNGHAAMTAEAQSDDTITDYHPVGFTTSTRILATKGGKP